MSNVPTVLLCILAALIVAPLYWLAVNGGRK